MCQESTLCELFQSSLIDAGGRRSLRHVPTALGIRSANQHLARPLQPAPTHELASAARIVRV